MSWRRLRKGELDHEKIWLPVALSTFAAGAVWLRLELPLPKCAFHQFTGHPCPSCGVTRAARQLLYGHLVGALHFNPLAVILFGLIITYCLYAAVVLAFDLPRWRLEGPVSRQQGRWWRIGVCSAVAVNWAYLDWAGV